ncbi:MAG: hypothetical protein NTZ50_05435, partial [Chloroflexi bacterium]|nr:hypothetical protein [Chloroflexota bacterium]
SFVRQIRLPRFAGEANLPPELLATHLVFIVAAIPVLVRELMQAAQMLVFPAKHTILSPFGGENSVFRVGKMAGLSSYQIDFEHSPHSRGIRRLGRI